MKNGESDLAPVWKALMGIEHDVKEFDINGFYLHMTGLWDGYENIKKNGKDSPEEYKKFEEKFL